MNVGPEQGYQFFGDPNSVWTVKHRGCSDAGTFATLDEAQTEANDHDIAHRPAP